MEASYRPVGSGAAGGSSAGPIALRSAVFMKSPLTWV